ncbi:hypothetical protein [Yoonia algicola]|uniref:Uncharacterized protein n=1 Tax=Yoonia algicola TaxID=3137368 RepID=A0AAN0M9G2_9RHOB
MEENTQVLDVTYGNFSCRLEGFEDSVETMKMVVSFFHDLAGHDRFMDTEPLAPDMETLARLTEEQTGVAVDVEGEGNRVSLRVRHDDAEMAPELSEETDAYDAYDADEWDADDEIYDAPVEDEEPEDDDDSYASNLSSVADKLERMRAAAAERKSAPSADDFSEDLSEPAATAPAANPLSQRLSDLVKRTTAAAAAVPMEDDTPKAQAPVAEDDDLEDDLNVFNTAEIDEDIAAALAAEEADDEPLLADHVADDLTAETTDEPIAEETLDEDEASEDDIVAAQDDDAYEEETAFDDAQDDEDGDDPYVSDDADEDEAEVDEEPLLLTAKQAAEVEDDDYNDDDEFDLEAEVAKVEAEIAARQGNDFARPGLPRHVEDAMSRIMSQTDQHLNQPENRRHRDAFAQLKAAVAATEAARQLGDKGADKRDPDEVYKDDLGAHDAMDKGEGKSIPPLKLVKSQEVKPGAGDRQTLQKPQTPAPASASSMEAASERLRKIATLKESEAQPETNDFADFVASHGASDLTDQLEAAGAYICFIEGEDDFSRPQVMKMVQSASDSEISREDGLRSFGRLLRQARLIKLPNGRFQVADNTQYRPDGYKAARG